MTFWGFLAQLVWSVVVAGALYGFSEPIRRKLESTKKVTFLGGLDVEFFEQLLQANQATVEVVKLIEAPAKSDNPELAAKIGVAVEKAETANNAAISTLSGILRVTDAQDIASIRGTVGSPAGGARSGFAAGKLGSN